MTHGWDSSISKTMRELCRVTNRNEEDVVDFVEKLVGDVEVLTRERDRLLKAVEGIERLRRATFDECIITSWGPECKD